MKTSEFEKAIDGLNTLGHGNWYCSESVDTISVWCRETDSKGNIINVRLVSISNEISNDYVFFTKSNNYSHSNMEIDITVRKEFIDLINDYASTPIDEREDNADECEYKAKVDSLEAKVARLESTEKSFLKRTGYGLHSPFISDYDWMNVNSSLYQLKHDMDIIKSKKPNWFK